MKKIKGITNEIIELRFDGEKIHTFVVPVPEHLVGAAYEEFIHNWIVSHIWWVTKGSKDEE